MALCIVYYLCKLVLIWIFYLSFINLYTKFRCSCHVRNFTNGLKQKRNPNKREASSDLIVLYLSYEINQKMKLEAYEILDANSAYVKDLYHGGMACMNAPLFFWVYVLIDDLRRNA